MENNKSKRIKKHNVSNFKIAAITFAVIALFFSSSMIVHTVGNDEMWKFIVKNYNTPIGNDTPAFHTDTNGNFYFVKDNINDFKILQLTDTHYGGGIGSYKNDVKTLNAVHKLLQFEKPDLVVITGDVIYPMPFQTGTLNNMKSAQQFATFMEKMQVPWTIIFGNHDNDALSLAKRSELADFFSSENFKYCLFSKNPKNTAISGYGNHIITIKNADNTLNTALFLMDSHSYINGNLAKYDKIRDDQVEWYKNSILNMSTVENGIESGKVVPSLLFVHVPLNEYETAWNESINNNPEAKYLYGVCDQTIYAPFIDDKNTKSKIFDEMLLLGSTKAVFCGHCHKNNFAINYKGIQLSFSNSIVYTGISGIADTDAYRGGTRILIDNSGFKKSQLVYLKDIA